MKINPRTLGIVLLVMVIFVMAALWWRGRSSDAPAPRPDAPSSSSSPRAPATEDPTTLPDSDQLQQRLEEFVVAYESPLTEARSDTLRDLCLDDDSYHSLGADGDDTSAAGSSAGDTTMVLHDGAGNTMQPVWNTQTKQALVSSLTQVDVMTAGELEITLPIEHVSVWRYQDGSWLFVLLVN